MPLYSFSIFLDTSMIHKSHIESNIAIKTSELILHNGESFELRIPPSYLNRVTVNYGRRDISSKFIYNKTISLYVIKR